MKEKIYQDSVYKWKKYEKQLSHLKELLKDEIELVAVHDRAKELCRTSNVRGIALDVAGGLVARPVITPTWVQRHYGVSYPAANNAVARLEQLGLLREITGGSYGRMFAADDVLRILER